MIGVSSPAEEGDDNAAAAALSSEDFYSPNKSVRVAELDLALDLSIGRNHSKVHSKESLKVAALLEVVNSDNTNK
ncbi:unnamed protein product [Brassica rapa]|uniref:Uncharacterized protein n=1 Tax=Brassica campestris TaxID=3711 RepID=A0A8D9H542_BRACM|nr:unnamed protein product [Brassica rapa]